MIGRISRQKVRISRARLIDSMVRVADLISKNVSSSLEVEFYDEVGTGLGPTLEFYSSVCKELRKRGGVSVGDLDSAGSSPTRSSVVSLWRENTGLDEYLNIPEGLFPRPMSTEMLASDEGRKRLSVFKAMGAFIAKSLLDNRIVDLPLSPLLLRLAVWGFATADGATVPSLLEMIKDVDVSLCNSLTYVHKYVEAKLEIELNTDLSASARSLAISKVTIKNASIDDLSLDFTLPGYSDVEIKSSGSEIPITMENVGEYVSSVANMTVVEGVRQQIQAFRHGFDTVFPISSLQCFSVPELSLLFGGSHDEDWSLLTIMEAIKADHGYTSDSRTVHDLAALMHSFSNLERREFLMFVTGSPKLPIGGFKSLSPPLTVVRKGSDYGLKADAYLPSVMTCVNYLKVPAYSDLEVMRQRFEIAIKEGQGSFHLS
ncbi:Ubiquitin fusion degradation protein 4 [Chytriomyces hyalinus]|nr:Ubiquitin fusion degradation protein 4 [Chytriomyces hyalinus]